ncbi:MAG: hypothetical protein GWO04_01910, partial [Actinobacteria bacterium]|nr:hypothetical protein [Actinomycetota bacterium]
AVDPQGEIVQAEPGDRALPLVEDHGIDEDELDVDVLFVVDDERLAADRNAHEAAGE